MMMMMISSNHGLLGRDDDDDVMMEIMMMMISGNHGVLGRDKTCLSERKDHHQYSGGEIRQGNTDGENWKGNTNETICISVLLRDP